jgi:hypothetical protein
MFVVLSGNLTTFIYNKSKKFKNLFRCVVNSFSFCPQEQLLENKTNGNLVLYQRAKQETNVMCRKRRFRYINRPALTNAAMLLMPIAAISSRPCTKPNVGCSF